MEYSQYGPDDFLLDDHFVDWVRIGKDDQFWRDFLRDNPAQRSAVEQARSIILAAATLPVVAPTTGQVSQMWQTVEQSIHRKPVSQVRPLWGVPTWAYWAAAASVVLLLFVGRLWFSQKSSHYITYQQLVEETTLTLQEVQNSGAKTKLVPLPDGSTVHLAPDSRLSFPKMFEKMANREVFLTGEAFFEVTKNPKQPFLVYADGLTTRVVGTSFTIRSGGKKVSVLVRTGRVTVYPMQETDPSEQSERKVMLTPNQQATFHSDANQLTRTIVADPLVLQAESQPISFEFDNTPIAEVFDRLEQAYGLSIQYDKSIMKNCQLTVPLRDEPFFAKLTIICQTIGASYKIDGTQIVISSEGCK